MAAKLVNLGFGFGPQRNPRSGPPRVSREGDREREREGGEGGAEGDRGRGRERKREQGRGREAATASAAAAAAELLTSIHHCVTKNELERERGKGGSYVQDVHFFLYCENRRAIVPPQRRDRTAAAVVLGNLRCVECYGKLN